MMTKVLWFFQENWFENVTGKMSAICPEYNVFINRSFSVKSDKCQQQIYKKKTEFKCGRYWLQKYERMPKSQISAFWL